MAEPRVAFRPAALLEVLNEHRVAYLLIGGIAARAHGANLHTGDVDNLLTRFGRLDVIWRPAGSDGYDDLVRDAWVARIRGVEVSVASLDALIASKTATGRDKDRRWLGQLQYLREQRNSS